MNLNGVIAIILHYLHNSIALQADYVTVVEDRTISAKHRLPVTFGERNPRSSRTVSLRQLSFLIKKFKMIDDDDAVSRRTPIRT